MTLTCHLPWTGLKLHVCKIEKFTFFSILQIIISQHIWKAYYGCQFLKVLSHTSVNLFCRLDKNVNFGHLEQVSISYLLPAGGSIQAEVFPSVLSLSLPSAVWKCRLINMKRGSPTGPHVFSLPLSPAETSTLTSSLYLFPIHTQPHILSRAGVYLTLSFSWRVLIVFVPCTVGGWIVSS